MGVAATDTVVAPAVVDFVSALHWRVGIHSQFATPTYVGWGYAGATWTSAVPSCICPTAFFASVPGSGGAAGCPGATQIVCTLQVLPAEQLVHCHSEPSV